MVEIKIRTMNTILLDSRSVQNINLIAEIARKMKVNVFPISRAERESIEDMQLLKRMNTARLEGLANRNKTLSKLGIN